MTYTSRRRTWSISALNYMVQRPGNSRVVVSCEGEKTESGSYKVNEYLNCGCQMDGALSSGAQQQDKEQWAQTERQKFHLNRRKDFFESDRALRWAAQSGGGVSFSGDTQNPLDAFLYNPLSGV